MVAAQRKSSPRALVKSWRLPEAVGVKACTLSNTLACTRSVLAVSSTCRLLEDPVHWKDLTLAKTFEGLSYPSMALHAYSTSPSTCLKLTLSRRSAWHCWRRRSRRRRASLKGLKEPRLLGASCVGFKGFKVF